MINRLFIPALTLLVLTSSLAGQNSINSSVLRNHVTILASDSLRGRAFGFPEKTMAIEYIAGQFAEAGLTTLNGNYIQSFTHSSEMIMTVGKNIVGVIEGSDPQLKNEYILVGAHYDHLGWKIKNDSLIIFNGADDNASGVASLIEIGKYLAGRKADIKRTVLLVAFDGEEEGLLGSAAFVLNKTVDPSKIKIMFSLDMVGMLSKNGGVNLTGFNSMENGEKFAEGIAFSEMINVKKTINSIERRTDTWSFAKVNIPSIEITTGTVSPYHKPEDDSDLLDYEGMSKISGFVSSLILKLADIGTIEPDRGFITRSIDPKLRTGIRMGLGRNYHYYKDTFYQAKSVLALEAGIISQLKLSRLISLQPAISYEMTGSDTEAGKFYMHSLSPQLDILITTPANGIEMPKLFLEAGIYYRHGFSATKSTHVFDFSEKYLGNENGLNIGAGFQFMKLQMSYNYKYGLTKINRDETNGDIFNRSSYFTVIWLFR